MPIHGIFNCKNCGSILPTSKEAEMINLDQFKTKCPQCNTINIFFKDEGKRGGRLAIKGEKRYQYGRRKGRVMEMI